MEDVKTYAVALVGFWSVEFLNNWGGVAITFLTVLYLLSNLIKFYHYLQDRKESKKIKKIVFAITQNSLNLKFNETNDF